MSFDPLTAVFDLVKTGVDKFDKSVKKTGCAVTVENHSIFGGLGSAVAEVLGEHQPTLLKRIGINDCFGTSGQLESILDHYGLTSTQIAGQTEKLLVGKKL